MATGIPLHPAECFRTLIQAEPRKESGSANEYAAPAVLEHLPTRRAACATGIESPQRQRWTSPAWDRPEYRGSSPRYPPHREPPQIPEDSWRILIPRCGESPPDAVVGPPTVS